MDAGRVIQDVMRPIREVVSWLDTAELALARMRTLDCQRLPVVDAHGVIGLCDRGVLQSSQRRGNWMGSVSVGDLMRRGPFWCRVLDPSEKALRTMERLSTDVLAVIDQRGAIVGIVHRDQLTATHSAC